MGEIGWQSQQGKDLLLQGCVRGGRCRGMDWGVCSTVRVISLKAPSRRSAVGRAVARVGCVETSQRALLLGHAPPHSVFDQGEHAQG